MDADIWVFKYLSDILMALIDHRRSRGGEQRPEQIIYQVATVDMRAHMETRETHSGCKISSPTKDVVLPLAGQINLTKKGMFEEAQTR